MSTLRIWIICCQMVNCCFPISAGSVSNSFILLKPTNRLCLWLLRVSPVEMWARTGPRLGADWGNARDWWTPCCTLSNQLWGRKTWITRSESHPLKHIFIKTYSYEFLPHVYWDLIEGPRRYTCSWELLCLFFLHSLWRTVFVLWGTCPTTSTKRCRGPRGSRTPQRYRLLAQQDHRGRKRTTPAASVARKPKVRGRRITMW